MDSYSTSEEPPLWPSEIDLNEIFIGREDQLYQFRVHLERWQRLAATTSIPEIKAPPSPNNKIQAFIILMYGRGGFGKSTLLRNYREIALEYTPEIHVSDLIDWEVAAQERRSFFNPAQGEDIDAYQYFSFMCDWLALALGRSRTNFREYETAVKAVDEAKQQAQGVLKQLQRENSFAWLQTIPGEVVLTLIKSVPVLRNAPILTNDTITKAVSEAVTEGTKIGVERISQVRTKLSEKLGNRFFDYMDASWQLAKGLGYDLAQFAQRNPILIFFDTYEEIDEGDKLLQMIMAASGIRVGWVIAGRDNLWAGMEQRRRRLDPEYGYRDLTLSSSRMVVDFSADGVGDFTSSDIKEYFMQLHQKAHLLELPVIEEKDAAHIRDITGGVPLAVKIAAGLYLESFDLTSLIEDPNSKREIVDQMVERYLRHTRTNPDDRARLYGLAMLRRPEEQRAIAAALNIQDYYSELSRLQRRYGFIFTKQGQPTLHQEVRHFLRFWLLDHRTIRSDIIPVVQHIREALLTSFQELEAKRTYGSLRQRFEDEQWTGLYLDLTEQQFWLNPTEGIAYILPFMFAASIFQREINREARAIGEFFQRVLAQPYRKYWDWANESLVYNTSRNPLPEELSGLKDLVRLASQNEVAFCPPMPLFKKELEGALWWRLGEAYQGKNPDASAYWYEKALDRLPYEQDLIELDPKSVSAYMQRGEEHLLLKEYPQAIASFNHALERDGQNASIYARRGEAYLLQKEYLQAIADFDRALERDGQNASIYARRGEAYLLQKEYRWAIKDFNRALELEPSNEAFQAKRDEASSHLTSTLLPITPAFQDSSKPLHLSRRKALVIVLGSMVGLGLAAGGLIEYNLLQHSSKPPTHSSSIPGLPGDLICVYNKHSDNVVGVAWSPDGTRIASASYDHTVQVWDAANGSHNHTYSGHNQRVTCVAWSPDGTRIASGSDDHTVQVWDASNRHLLYTYRGHTSNVHTVSWSPDSTRIASGSSDQTVRVWHARDGSKVLIYNALSYVWTVAWSPDGTRIASGDSVPIVQVWDSHNGKLLLTYGQHSSRLHHLAWSPDGTRIASGGDDDSVQVWDAHNGKRLLNYLGHAGNVWTMAWSPDSTRIASGGTDTTVQVWDAHTGSLLLPYHNHHGGVASVAWSPDGARIASGSWDHTVQVWVAPIL